MFQMILILFLAIISAVGSSHAYNLNRNQATDDILPPKDVKQLCRKDNFIYSNPDPLCHYDKECRLICFKKRHLASYKAMHHRRQFGCGKNDEHIRRMLRAGCSLLSQTCKVICTDRKMKNQFKRREESFLGVESMADSAPRNNWQRSCGNQARLPKGCIFDRNCKVFCGNERNKKAKSYQVTLKMTPVLNPNGKYGSKIGSQFLVCVQHFCARTMNE